MMFIALFALISCKAEFTLHSHSGSWCDYWTGSGLVNIQVIQKGLSHTSNVTFNMTLKDQDGNEYIANCTIEAETDNDDKEEEELKEEGEEELKEEEEEELKEEGEEELKEEEEEELKEEGEEENLKKKRRKLKMKKLIFQKKQSQELIATSPHQN